MLYTFCGPSDGQVRSAGVHEERREPVWLMVLRECSVKNVKLGYVKLISMERRKGRE